MSKTEIRFGELGGGVIDIATLLNALNNATSLTSDSNGCVTGFTVGKTYLVIYARGNTTDHSLESGGEELYKYVYTNGGSSFKVYFGLITATNTVLDFTGNNNPTYVVQLD